MTLYLEVANGLYNNEILHAYTCLGIRTKYSQMNYLKSSSGETVQKEKFLTVTLSSRILKVVAVTG